MDGYHVQDRRMLTEKRERSRAAVSKPQKRRGKIAKNYEGRNKSETNLKKARRGKVSPMKFSESLVRDSFGQLVAYGVTDHRDRLTMAHRVLYVLLKIKRSPECRFRRRGE